jgi:hypothetical protein
MAAVCCRHRSIFRKVGTGFPSENATSAIDPNEEATMRNHSWLAAACVAVFVLVSGPARPQSPPPDALTAARELIVTMRAADQFKAILPVVVRNLKPAIVQGRPEVERDFDAIMPCCWRP